MTPFTPAPIDPRWANEALAVLARTRGLDAISELQAAIEATDSSIARALASLNREASPLSRRPEEDLEPVLVRAAELLRQRGRYSERQAALRGLMNQRDEAPLVPAGPAPSEFHEIHALLVEALGDRLGVWLGRLVDRRVARVRALLAQAEGRVAQHQTAFRRADAPAGDGGAVANQNRRLEDLGQALARRHALGELLAELERVQAAGAAVQAERARGALEAVGGAAAVASRLVESRQVDKSLMARDADYLRLQEMGREQDRERLKLKGVLTTLGITSVDAVSPGSYGAEVADRLEVLGREARELEATIRARQEAACWELVERAEAGDAGALKALAEAIRQQPAIFPAGLAEGLETASWLHDPRLGSRALELVETASEPRLAARPAAA